MKILEKMGKPGCVSLASDIALGHVVKLSLCRAYKAY